MAIDLSEKEYRLLLDMIYIARWVMYAYSDNEDAVIDESDEYMILKQKLLICAEEAGLTGLLEYSAPETGG